MPEQMTKQKLEVLLRQFTGTSAYYQTGINTVSTDGVLYLANEAQAYWLLDIIDSVAPFDDFAILKMTVTEDEKGRRADIIIDSGHDPEDEDEKDSYQLFHKQHVPFTDFMLDEIKLYIQESEHGPVIMLPSEY